MNTPAPVSELVRLAGQELHSYTEVAHANKEAFHRRAKAVAKLIAAELGLAPGSYDVRSNKAGIAVGGEVTLHSDTLYVQFGQGFNREGFLYRSCRGRKDYTGGSNHWMRWRELLDFARAVQNFRVVAGLEQPAQFHTPSEFRLAA
jgi:hypothetical protein